MAQKKKKSGKSKRSHSFILTVCFISLAIIFVISLVSIKKEIDARNAEVASLKSSYAEISKKNAELQSIVDSGDQDDYVEKVAREDYGYIKPGDRVYEDIASGE